MPSTEGVAIWFTSIFLLMFIAITIQDWPFIADLGADNAELLRAAAVFWIGIVTIKFIQESGGR